MVSKETKVDILVTAGGNADLGGIGAKLLGPAIGWCMLKLGDLIMTATEWQPFVFGIVISVVVGLALTAPISVRLSASCWIFPVLLQARRLSVLRTDGRLRCSKL